MPLYRRLPRKGFSNHRFRRDRAIVNVGMIDAKFGDGDTVDIQALKTKGLVKGKYTSVKVLGNGELAKRITLMVDAVSDGAKAKVEKAGGQVSAIGVEQKVEAHGE